MQEKVYDFPQNRILGESVRTVHVVGRQKVRYFIRNVVFYRQQHSTGNEGKTQDGGVVSDYLEKITNYDVQLINHET